MKKEEKNYEIPLVTELLPLFLYYPAEDYHQNYLDKHPNGYCHIPLEWNDMTKKHRDRKEKPISIVNPVLYPKPTEQELRSRLTPLQYDVVVNKMTEHPYFGEYVNHHEKGIYVDIATGEPLFTSMNKYDSGCGWPSFTKPLDPKVLIEQEDHSYGLHRTEVLSRTGHSHLGHVFPDGPPSQGGLRYCINSAALRFIKYENLEKEGYDFLKFLFDDPNQKEFF